MWSYALPLFFLGVVNVFLGVVVAFRNVRKYSNLSFVGLTLSTGLWCVGIGALYLSVNSFTALTWTRFYYGAPAILVLSLVIFSLVFPEERISGKRLVILSIPMLITLGSLTLYPNAIIKEINQLDDRSWSVVLNIRNYSLYAMYISAYFLIGLAILYRKSKFNTLQAQQASGLFFGLVISAVLGLIFNLYLPAVGNYQLIWAGPLATTIFATLSTFTIIRHHMFDIRGFVLRSVMYSFITITLSILYVAPIVYTIIKVVGIPFIVSQFVIAVIFGTIAATNYHRISDWFNRVSNKIFFRESYNPTELISELNRVLVGRIEIEKLLRTAGDVIEKHLKPEFCYFIIKDKNLNTRVIGSKPHNISLDSRELLQIFDENMLKKSTLSTFLTSESLLGLTMNNNYIGIVSPLQTVRSQKEKSVGYLVVGVRKSGKGYSIADGQVLDTISDVLIIATQNALNVEEIQQFNETLQQKVDDATRKLRMTNEKLRRLDETKDEFISMASHQLRTPLTSVKGYLSMVVDGDVGKLNKQQRELLTQSYLSSQRMVNLISDLLNLSRLSTGKFVIDYAPVDLREVIDEELMQLRDTADARGVELVYERPETFPTIRLDDNKTHQVVMNFVDNAIYYTPSGGKVTLELVETPTSIEFRVKDNGIGVPRALQRHLFTKFYRAENARRVRPDGTGLGLFMAKKVIIAQGGSIIFESQEGKGSTFGFRFSKKVLADETRKHPVEIQT